MSDLPKIINDYTLTKLLGSGGFAIAYQAEKENKKYCIRQLKLGQTNGSDDAWKTWDLFKREADVLSALDHSRIPKVYDYFTAEDGQNGSAVIYAYMAQTLIPGENLRTILSHRGRFTEEQIVALGLQLSDILKYTHHQAPSVIHRDIKPSNIHQDEQGQIYLLDFGALQQEITKTCGGSTTFGTLGYAPLELTMGKAVTQSDLYMVGATFLYLLTGIEPEKMLEYNSNGLLQFDYKPHYQFVNPSLELIVQQLTQPLPKDRIQTTEQLTDYLQQIKDGRQLRFNSQTKINFFSRAIASIIPKGALEHLVQTRPAEIEQARQHRTLITGGEPIAPSPSDNSQIIPIDDNYILMPQKNTYALGVLALQEACVAENNTNHPKYTFIGGSKIYGSKIVRPLTFLENIQARIHDFETQYDHQGNKRTLEDRKRYFNTWLDSSCGVAYKADSTKLKLQLICPSLFTLPRNFNESFIPIDYYSFQGSELDSSSKNFVQDAWMTLLEGKTDVCANYLKMLKTITGNDITTNFWVRSKDNLKTDELRAVCVNFLGYYSNAGGINLLNYCARFLRRSP